MKKIKLTALSVLFLLTLFSLFSCGSDEPDVSMILSPGLEVLSSELTVVKCGLKGVPVSFDGNDLKEQLGVDPGAITITYVPQESDGTLSAGERLLKAGDSVSAGEISDLVFIPSGRRIERTAFGFSSDALCFAGSVRADIYLLASLDLPPVLDANTLSAPLETYKNVSVFSRVSASDPENDVLKFELVELPIHGRVEFTDAGDGTFVYTPAGDYTGRDRFTYRAVDFYGNCSDVGTAEVKVVKTRDDTFFADMINHPQHAHAVYLAENKIMKGSYRDGQTVFLPEREVTRAEFLSYVVKLTGKNAEEVSSRFADEDEIPVSLRPYALLAANSGWIKGEFTSEGTYLRPNDIVTAGEAAAILSNAFGKGDAYPTSAFVSGGATPSYAEDAIASLRAEGMFPGGIGSSEKLTKSLCAQILYPFSEK